MSELVFYTNPQSRGRIAHWMIEETGLPYRTVWVAFGAEMKGPSYRNVNPMGKVPALQDGAAVVTEAAAICAYLAERNPERALAPPIGDPARAAYYRWLFFAAGPLEQATTAQALGWQVPPGRNTMVGFGSYDDTLQAIETALMPGPWICGEAFTAADVYIGSALGWGMMFGTVDKRPAFEAYVARAQQRPAWQRAQALNEARLREIEGASRH
jgi:glutathione S-transferase